MRSVQRPLAILLLALVLIAGAAAPVLASDPASRSASRPLTAEWLEGINIGKPTDRTTVVRVTALTMALALFIMFRKKH